MLEDQLIDDAKQPTIVLPEEDITKKQQELRDSILKVDTRIEELCDMRLKLELELMMSLKNNE